MFKHTVIGLALAAALEDLTAAPYNHAISDATREAIWEEFEEGMRQALSAVPKTHKAFITPSEPTYPQARHTADPFSQNSLEVGSQRTPQPATASLVASAAESMAVSSFNAVTPSLASIPAGIDPVAQFPMYRYVDGKWTILMKDVEVRVRVPASTAVVTTAATPSTKNGKRQSKAALKDISVHCDYLEIEAEGNLSKAQRQLEVAQRKEELERLHKTLSADRSKVASNAKGKKSSRAAKGTAAKRSRE